MVDGERIWTLGFVSQHQRIRNGTRICARKFLRGRGEVTMKEISEYQ